MARLRPQKKKRVLEQAAWNAVELLSGEIGYDERLGDVTGAEEVGIGLDAAADALAALHDLEADGGIDTVLSDLKVSEEVVEAAARLDELVSRASYSGGLGPDGVRQAEKLREFVYASLGELLENGKA